MKRNGIVQKAIQSEETNRKERLLDWKYTQQILKEIDEDLLPEGCTLYVGSSNITIRVPWGLEYLGQARRAMGSRWKFSSNYTDTNGTLTKTYYTSNLPEHYDQRVTGKHYSSVWLSLIMDSEKLEEGSCRRIEVGEKTYTQKVYQVVCDDSVKEVLGKAEAMEDDI